MKISTLIIGLGNIGMGYDNELDPKKFCLTHACAVSQHNNFTLLGAVDLDQTKRKNFEKKFEKPSFESISTALKKLMPDLIIIATPTEDHLKSIIKITQTYIPKIILCEKPISYKIREAQEILRICNNHKINLFVNYYKRCDISILKIKKLILKQYKNIEIKGTVWYSKGLIHNGSHFLDLMIDFFGPIQQLKIINKNGNIDKFDYNPDFSVKFSKASIIFISTPENSVTYHTVELLFKEGMLIYKNGGEIIEWKEAKKDKFSKKYKILNDEKFIIDNKYNLSQYNIIDEIYNHIYSKKTYNLCSGKDSIYILQSICNLLELRN